jgi:hypothetical protein
VAGRKKEDNERLPRAGGHGVGSGEKQEIKEGRIPASNRRFTPTLPALHTAALMPAILPVRLTLSPAQWTHNPLILSASDSVSVTVATSVSAAVLFSDSRHSLSNSLAPLPHPASPPGPSSRPPASAPPHSAPARPPPPSLPAKSGFSTSTMEGGGGAERTPTPARGGARMRAGRPSSGGGATASPRRGAGPGGSAAVLMRGERGE